MITLAKIAHKWLLQPLFLGIAITLASMSTSATQLTLSDTPLFLTTNVAPNVILTIDDSLSMMRGYVPETVDNTQTALDGPRFKSAYYNGMYYNPTLTYAIPTRSDGTSYTTSFASADFNGFDTTSKDSVNLSTGYKVIAQSKPSDTLSGCTTYIVANNANGYTGPSCILAKNPATTTTTPYSYTCSVAFTKSGSTYTLATSGCGTIFSASTSPVGTSIVVTGSSNSANNKTYTIKSIISGGTSITVNQTVTTASSSANTGLSWSVSTTSGTTTAVSAYYYLYYSQKGAALPAGCNDNKETDACYIKIDVGSTSDIAVGTTANQKQNFANWYSFYRTRAMAVMSGAMTAVTGLADASVRLGWHTISQCPTFGTACKGYDNTNRENQIRTLSATYKTNFYNWIQRFDLSGSTPMRTTMQATGEYFKTSGTNSPYAEDPYVTDGTTELSCRKNFNVTFTDGLWNSTFTSSTPITGTTAPVINDLDSSSLTLSDGTAYTPQAPYRDVSTTSGLSSTYSNSNSLADIAYYYWATDLRAGTTGLTNNVTPFSIDQTGTTTAQYWNPKNDPATWQHMVNFTIGLGLSDSLVAACNYDQSTNPVVADPNNPTPGCPVWGGDTYAGDYAALLAGTKNWPKINTNVSAGSNKEPDGHVYDLWHAAINSRGKFFNAGDPISLNAAFSSIFTSIISSNASSAAAAANSTSIQTGTVLYQAQFSSQNWAGHLFSFAVSSDGTVKDLNSDGKLDGNDANWDAATLIPAASRNIRTFKGGAGVDFIWGNLSTAQQTALKTSSVGVVGTDTMGQDRLNWLRGDTTKEVRNSGIFRNRTTTVLGDIINSDPTFSYTEDYGYTSLPVTATERSTYAAFVSGKNSGTTLRPPMVFDGANDGMLHAFRADTGNASSGKELFAYVPAAVYGNLSSLTEPAYLHKYFVDGSPTVGDAYLSGAWKTVLLGGLGKGGKAIYALNISTPDAFTDAHVLWEYSGSTVDTGSTGTTDADGMGLTYSQPQIARLNDGTWAAIFGNGYNSTSERAFLYIVNLSTGALIKKIPTNTATSNGLSTPKLYDSNNDKIIDFVYAGDLQGNMWKFDLSGATSASWGLGNGGNPLFIARNSSNLVQPITAQPTVGAHPSGGVLVYFGTGSYLTTADVSDITVQSFYAIWDKPSATTTVDRSSLVRQTIDEQVASGTTKTIAGCTDDSLTPGDDCVVTFNFTTRGTSANTVDYTSKFGWYMDLLPVSGTAVGERVVSAALLKHDRVIFLTAIPSADPCAPGGDSWLMEIDASTGGRTAVSSFDFNNDDKFDDKDKLPSTHTASGVKSTVGMVKIPVWLEKEGTGTAIKEMSGTTSNIMSLKNKGNPVTPSTGTVNRLYWQQIQ